jgi:hypothetical protein
MDPRSAPETVLRGHAPNELLKLQIDAWPSRPPPRATPPASTEPFTMPTGDRGRLDQQESLPPPGPEPSQAHPEETVRRAEASIRTREYTQLDGAGQEARGGSCHAWTGRTGGPRPSGRPHASPVVWPAAARTSTNSCERNCGEPQGLQRLMTLYCSYHARSRTHLSLDKDTPIPRPVTPPSDGAVVAIPEGRRPPLSLRTARSLNAGQCAARRTRSRALRHRGTIRGHDHTPAI